MGCLPYEYQDKLKRFLRKFNPCPGSSRLSIASTNPSIRACERAFNKSQQPLQPSLQERARKSSTEILSSARSLYSTMTDRITAAHSDSPHPRPRADSNLSTASEGLPLHLCPSPAPSEPARRHRRKPTNLLTHPTPHLHVLHSVPRAELKPEWMWELDPSLHHDASFPKLIWHRGFFAPVPAGALRPSHLKKHLFYLHYTPSLSPLPLPLSNSLPEDYRYLHDDLGNPRGLDAVVEGLFRRLEEMAGEMKRRRAERELAEEWLLQVKGEMEGMLMETETFFMGWWWWREFAKLDVRRRRAHASVMGAESGVRGMGWLVGGGREGSHLETEGDDRLVG